MNHVIIWTLKRGILERPELVDEETEKMIQISKTMDYVDRRSSPQWVDEGEYRTHYVRGRRA